MKLITLSQLPVLQEEDNSLKRIEKIYRCREVKTIVESMRLKHLRFFDGINLILPIEHHEMDVKTILENGGPHWERAVHFLLCSKMRGFKTWNEWLARFRTVGLEQRLEQILQPDVEDELHAFQTAIFMETAREENIRSFLCNDAVLGQLSLQPELLFQWLTAVMHVITGFEHKMSEFYYLPVPEEFKEKLLSLNKLLKKTYRYTGLLFDQLECQSKEDHDVKVEDLDGFEEALSKLHGCLKFLLEITETDKYLDSLKVACWKDWDADRPSFQLRKDARIPMKNRNFLFNLNFWMCISREFEIFGDSNGVIKFDDSILAPHVTEGVVKACLRSTFKKNDLENVDYNKLALNDDFCKSLRKQTSALKRLILLDSHIGKGGLVGLVLRTIARIDVQDACFGMAYHLVKLFGKSPMDFVVLANREEALENVSEPSVAFSPIDFGRFFKNLSDLFFSPKERLVNKSAPENKAVVSLPVKICVGSGSMNEFIEQAIPVRVSREILQEAILLSKPLIQRLGDDNKNVPVNTLEEPGHEEDEIEANDESGPFVERKNRLDPTGVYSLNARNSELKANDESGPLVERKNRLDPTGVYSLNARNSEITPKDESVPFVQRKYRLDPTDVYMLNARNFELRLKEVVLNCIVENQENAKVKSTVMREWQLVQYLLPSFIVSYVKICRVGIFDVAVRAWYDSFIDELIKSYEDSVRVSTWSCIMKDIKMEDALTKSCLDGKNSMLLAFFDEVTGDFNAKIVGDRARKGHLAEFCLNLGSLYDILRHDVAFNSQKMKFVYWKWLMWDFFSRVQLAMREADRYTYIFH